MTSQKKNLGRALALVLTIGSFLGLTAMPAMATWDPNNPAWQLDVNVTDSTCVPDFSEPSWAPDQLLYTVDNNVDMFAPSTVNFEVYLNFSHGTDANVCGDPNISPTGEVTASFNGDPALQLQGLDCQLACQASDLYTMGSTIQGQVTVNGGTAPGTYSGTLSVTWTPAG